jgi:rhodanese-related sulfurtransferase
MTHAKAPKVLDPKEAHRLLQDNPKAVFVDVRSRMEYLFVGHPKGALHVPWMDEPNWTVNPHFVTEVRKLMLGGAVVDHGDTPPLVLICRSGKRSFDAGLALIKAGFRNVYNVDEGFEGDLDDEHHRGTLGGWRYHGLPWEQC